MFDIQIKFIILSIDVKKDSIVHYILSANKDNFDYPSYVLNDKSSINESKKICFENYISLKLEWIEHRILDISQEKNIISIYYLCNVPIESKTVNGFFIPFNQVVFDPILQKAIRSA